MLVASSGAICVQLSPAPGAISGAVEVAAVASPVNSGDWRLRHKTTDRGFYDDARRGSGAFEVVLERPDGQVTEGSFTSVFVERDGVLLTPPLSAGLLPGVLRARLIDEGRAREAELTLGDLAGGFFVGNALRGLIPARMR